MAKLLALQALAVGALALADRNLVDRTSASRPDEGVKKREDEPDDAEDDEDESDDLDVDYPDFILCQGVGEDRPDGDHHYGGSDGH